MKFPLLFCSVTESRIMLFDMYVKLYNMGEMSRQLRRSKHEFYPHALRQEKIYDEKAFSLCDVLNFLCFRL